MLLQRGVIQSRTARPAARRSRAKVLNRVRSFPVTYEQSQQGQLSTIRVGTPLAGRVYYFWWVDGTYAGMTAGPEYVLLLPAGEQARVECVPSQNPLFDYLTYGPSTPPARALVWWIGSPAADVDYYRIDQAADGGAWSELGQVVHASELWDYRYLTPRLDDLTSYAWRVVSIDKAGNEGPPIVQSPRAIVRAPDAPDYTAAFDEGTTRVTFSAG